MAQHENLEILGAIPAAAQDQQVDHEPDETVETGHAPILIDPGRADQIEARNPRSIRPTSFRHPQDDLVDSEHRDSVPSPRRKPIAVLYSTVTSVRARCSQSDRDRRTATRPIHHPHRVASVLGAIPRAASTPGVPRSRRARVTMTVTCPCALITVSTTLPFVSSGPRGRVENGALRRAGWGCRGGDSA